MADTPGSNGAQPTDTAPSLNALAQYAKDISFENPNAPRSLGPQEKGPNIAIQVNVNAKQLSETDFEVDIALEGSAGEGADTLFRFELAYAGVFRLRNMPADQVHPLIMIECPRLRRCRRSSSGSTRSPRAPRPRPLHELPAGPDPHRTELEIPPGPGQNF